MLSVLWLQALLVTAVAQAFFTTPLSKAEMANKQAVIETSAGTIVIALLPDAAPNHVGLFMKLAREGAYDGTTFHRVIRYGLVQGGDPLTKNPANIAKYGQGGLRQLRREPNAEKHTSGAVSGVMVPGDPNSAGAQFFICASDQPTLDGQFDVFARVVEGLEVVQQISTTEADANGIAKARIVINKVTIRETPPLPFVNESAAELARHPVTIETTMGTIELEMLADKAPETVRRFLRWADAGVYDGIKVHRVVPNFVIQTGALAFRDKPLSPAQQALVANLPAEFTDTPNLPGIVSIARGDDPGSGTTSFFICIGECRALDGKYTVFAKVSAGIEVLKSIGSVPVNGETPRTEIVVRRVTVRK
jgi:cyclophilin family peptidyl-prolyl cis-trans isomerase